VQSKQLCSALTRMRTGAEGPPAKTRNDRQHSQVERAPATNTRRDRQASKHALVTEGLRAGNDLRRNVGPEKGAAVSWWIGCNTLIGPSLQDVRITLKPYIQKSSPRFMLRRLRSTSPSLEPETESRRVSSASSSIPAMAELPASCMEDDSSCCWYSCCCCCCCGISNVSPKFAERTCAVSQTSCCFPSMG
jgi:hypothetical protein